jgi:hypothetical protein
MTGIETDVLKTMKQKSWDCNQSGETQKSRGSSRPERIAPSRM